MGVFRNHSARFHGGIRMMKTLGILIIALTAVKCQDDYYEDECSGSGDYDDYYGSGCPDEYPDEYPNDDCECAHDFVMDKNSGQ